VNITKSLELKVFDLDTRRKPDRQQRQASVAQAREIIDTWKPDVLVISDDNAAADLVVPHYRHTALPVVFCGINWTAEEYGFPCKNVTGMIEVTYIDRVVADLRPYAKGNRIGVLAADNETAHKEITHFERVLKTSLKPFFVATFEAWKQAFIDAQTSCDLLIVLIETGIDGFDMYAAREFTLMHTRIPTGTINDTVASLVLLGQVKYGEEQGEWAASAVLQILDGVPVSAIPVVTNKRAHVYANMGLAKKLGITLPYDLVSQAVFTDTLP
jgi:ABC-type uncharacterized transport system substrate-binding protein